MSKEIVLCLLFFVVPQIIGSQNLEALPCVISYCDKKIEKIKKNNPNNFVEYGFRNLDVSLVYSQEHERGVIYLYNTESILQSLIIPKQQFSDIANMIRSGFSLAQFKEPNKVCSLKSPLYITVEQDDDYIFYKIHSFKEFKLSP